MPWERRNNAHMYKNDLKEDDTNIEDSSFRKKHTFATILAPKEGKKINKDHDGAEND